MGGCNCNILDNCQTSQSICEEYFIERNTKLNRTKNEVIETYDLEKDLFFRKDGNLTDRIDSIKNENIVETHNPEEEIKTNRFNKNDYDEIKENDEENNTEKSINDEEKNVNIKQISYFMNDEKNKGEQNIEINKEENKNNNFINENNLSESVKSNKESKNFEIYKLDEQKQNNENILKTISLKQQQKDKNIIPEPFKTRLSETLENATKKINNSSNSLFPIIIINNDYYENTLSFLEEEIILNKEEKNIQNYILKYNSSIEILHKLLINKNSIKNYLSINFPHKYEEILFAEARIDIRIFSEFEEDELYFQLLKNNLFKNDYLTNINEWVKNLFEILKAYINNHLKLNFIYYENEKNYPSLFYIKNDNNIKFPDNLSDYESINKYNFWNIIYHDERKISINRINEEINYIENEINCNLLITNTKEELLNTINLIKKQNEDLKANIVKIKTVLLLKEDLVKGVLDYIKQNENFTFFEQILVICDKDEKKEDGYNYDESEIIKIIKNKTELVSYLKENKPDSISINLNRIITLEEYNKKYILLHEKIAKYYNKNISKNDFNKLISDLSVYLYDQKKPLKIKLSKSSNENSNEVKIEALINSLKETFGDFQIDQNARNTKILKKYFEKENTFTSDFNYWLNELEENVNDKISYFISNIIFSFNENYKNVNQRKKFLFKSIKTNLIDLLLYKKNEEGIITIPYFLHTSINEEETIKNSGINEVSYKEIKLRKKQEIFNVFIKIEYNYKNDNYPSCFEYNNECIFMPFTFFKIKSAKIDIVRNISNIELIVVNKKEILENYLNENSELIYDEFSNSVKIKKVNNILIHCIDEKELYLLKEKCEFLKEITTGNFLITNTNEYFKYILEQIKYENNNKNKIMIKFELILFENSANEALEYIKTNNYFLYFNNIIIMTGNENKYKQYDSVYNSIKIFNTKSSLMKFLRETNYGSFLSLKKNIFIILNDYYYKYIELHEIISNYYQKLSKDYFEVFNLVLKNYFLDKNPLLNRNELSQYLNIYKDNNENILERHISIIDAYIENKNLIQINSNNSFKVGFFLSNLLFSLNEYGKIENKGLTGQHILYSRVFLSFSDLLLYKQNINNIISILLPVFVSLDNTENFEYLSIEKENKFDVLLKFNYNCQKNNVPIAIDISEISIYNEDEIFILLPFTFYEIINVSINNEKNTAEIEYNVIMKKNIIENEISKNKILMYNNKQKIIETSNNVFVTYYINDNDDKKSVRIFGKEFVTNNKSNIKLLIDGEENTLSEFYTFKQRGENTIQIIILNELQNLSYMFSHCSSLFSIEGLKNLNTNNVINTSNMFEGCSMLNHINALKNWNVNNVKEMSKMFFNCSSLKSIDFLKNWDMRNVENISDMFSGCNSLESIDALKNWEINNLKNISDLFGNCYSIKSIKALKNWKTFSIKNTSFMFYNCINLISINSLKNWDTQNIENSSSMFSCCSSLKSIDALRNWNTKNLIDISNMFSGCSSIESIDCLKNWNTENIIDFSGLFFGCSSLNNINALRYWDTGSVMYTFDMFSGCSSLISIEPLKNWIWNINKITNMSNMFANCSSIKTLEALRFWNVEFVENISSMFSGCSSIISVDPLINWKVENIQDSSAMFSNCSSLKSIDALSNWKMKNVQNTSCMFMNCTSLSSLEPLKKWNMNEVVAASAMFAGCNKLETIDDLKEWDIKNMIDLTGIFSYCSSLKNVESLMSWNLYNVEDTTDMFAGCSPEIITNNIKNSNSINGKKLYEILCDSIIGEENEEIYSEDDVEKIVYDPKKVKFIEYNLENMNFDWCIKIFGTNFVERNKDKIYLMINKIQVDLCSEYLFQESGKTKIEIIETEPINDFSSMFEGCTSLTSLDSFKNLDTSNVINTSYMFYNCFSLNNIDALKNWNMNNVEDATDMFYGCVSLTSIDALKTWNLQKLGGFEKLFSGCFSINVNN